MEASNAGAEKGLLQDAEINKRMLMDAIDNGDVKTTKQLIGVGMDINFIHKEMDIPLSPLHAALKLGSMDMLEILLSQPNIDLNISNELPAPLIWSFLTHTSFGRYLTGGVTVPEELILRLIRAGCDINRSSWFGEIPLPTSVNYCGTAITHELLKQGADINGQGFSNDTALHYAVRKNDLELVCMLLNYNADVFIKNNDGHTPFSYALHLKYHNIAKVLSDYYSFLDDDVNYIINNLETLTVFLTYTNAKLFKAVWPRFYSELILCKHEFYCFINGYILWCRYSTSDWVECLYLILNSDNAINCNSCYFLCELLRCMRDQHVPSDDRIRLIYMVLTLGTEITIYEFNYAVKIYGLNQDLEPFMYSTYSPITDDDFGFACPLHAFVIGMETDFSVKKIIQLFHDALKQWTNRFESYDQCILAETFAKTVAFFSFPADAKNSLMSLKDFQNHVIMDKERLQEIPEFLSLMELSRNQIHKYLVHTFSFKQPYQLQDCVKKLLIPNRIKDIILFKEPIY